MVVVISLIVVVVVVSTDDEVVSWTREEVSSFTVDVSLGAVVPSSVVVAIVVKVDCRIDSDVS